MTALLMIRIVRHSKHPINRQCTHYKGIPEANRLKMCLIDNQKVQSSYERVLQYSPLNNAVCAVDST